MGVMGSAMKQFPATMDKAERWKKIAEAVPGKTKVECIKRVKWIREEMLKKKWLVSSATNTPLEYRNTPG